jgi:hypothetical protein
MSFDLHFKPVDRVSQPVRYHRFFISRPNYLEIWDEYHYENPITGATFRFEVCEARYPVTFRISYNRPSQYIREAVEEISALVKQFGFQVNDPQSEEAADKDFNLNDFISSWENSNDYALDVVKASEIKSGIKCLRIQEWVLRFLKWLKEP